MYNLDLDSLECPSIPSLGNLESETRNNEPQLSNDSMSLNFETALTEIGVSTLQSEEKEACDMLESMQSQLRELCGQLNEFKKKIDTEKSVLEKQCMTLQEDKRVLTDEFKKKFDKEKSVLEKQCMNLQEDNRVLTDEQQESAVTIDNFTKIVADLTEENERLLIRCDESCELRQKLKKKDKAISLLMKNIEERDNVMDQVLEKNKCLIRERDLFKKKEDKFSDIQDPNELSKDISIAITRLQEENSQLKDAIERQNITADAMKERVRLAKRQQEESTRNLDEQSEENATKLKEQFEEYDKLDEKNKELSRELRSCKTLVNVLETEIRHLDGTGCDHAPS